MGFMTVALKEALIDNWWCVRLLFMVYNHHDREQRAAVWTTAIYLLGSCPMTASSVAALMCWICRKNVFGYCRNVYFEFFFIIFNFFFLRFWLFIIGIAFFEMSNTIVSRTRFFDLFLLKTINFNLQIRSKQNNSKTHFQSYLENYSSKSPGNRSTVRSMNLVTEQIILIHLIRITVHL